LPDALFSAKCISMTWNALAIFGQQIQLSEHCISIKEDTEGEEVTEKRNLPLRHRERGVGEKQIRNSLRRCASTRGRLRLFFHHFLISPSRESGSAVPLSDCKLWCHSTRRRAFTSTILCRTVNRCLGWLTFVGAAAAKVGLRAEDEEVDPRSLFVTPPAASPRVVWFDKSLRPTFSKSPLISPE
jgi:hypothetical protein